MQNKLTDLNNHLFVQLERLNDEDLKGEELTQEIERAKAIANISSQIIHNGALALKAEELRLDYSGKNVANLPEFLEV